MQLSYADVLFRKLTGLGEVFGTGTAIHNPVPVSPSFGVSRTMGAGRLLLREGPGVKYELSQVSPLSAQKTLEGPLPPLHLLPKPRLMKSGLSLDSSARQKLAGEGPCILRKN